MDRRVGAATEEAGHDRHRPFGVPILHCPIPRSLRIAPHTERDPATGSPAWPRRIRGNQGPGGVRAPLAIAEHVFAPTPVLYPEIVVTQNLVYQDHPVGAVAAPVALVSARVAARTGRARSSKSCPQSTHMEELLRRSETRRSAGARSLTSFGSEDFGPWVVVGLGSRVSLDEVVGYLLHRRPAYAVVAVDVVDQPLKHQQDLRPARDVRMDGKRVHRVVHLPVYPVELVSPHLLYVPRVDEAVAIGRAFYEHHRRQVVQIPVTADLDQIYLLTAHERLHPLACRLGVVDLGPRIADPGVVRGEIAVLKTV